MVVYKEWADLGHDEWKEPGFLGLIRNVTSVHEDVLSPAVAMEITKYLEFSFLGELMTELLRRKDRRVQYFAGSLPSSIQIATCQRTSIIPVDHAIRIQHRNDLEHEVLSQIFGLD